MKTVHDLFKKIEHDFEVLRKNPSDAHACFNFFVTTEHLPEWYLDADAKRADAFRRNEAILRICSHLANGAKHFVVKNKKHSSVQSTNQVSQVSFRASSQLSRPSDESPSEEFVVQPGPEEASELGSQVAVSDLAHKIVTFWRKTLQNKLV
ncbi:MAG: hypothetical protein IID34_05950 [Planctomycetes bacterium]|nr:hypothetical protein [Planctomycetota bacterium]